MIRAAAILFAVLATAPAVVHATDRDFTSLSKPKPPPTPRAVLTAGERVAAIATGVDIVVESAFGVTPRGKQYSALKTLRDIGINASDLALDSKSDAVVRELRMLGGDLDALEALHAQGVHLRSDPRARAILDKMFDRRDDLAADGRAFYRRAMVSVPGLYNTILASAMEVSFQARELGKGGRRTVKYAWLDGEKLARGLTGSKWKQMNARARLAAAFGSELRKNIVQELIDEQMKQRASKLIREQLDQLYAEAFNVPRGRRLRPGDLQVDQLRVLYGLRPDVVAPIARMQLAEAARPVALAPAAVAPVALARPPEVARPVALARAPDPVVQMISNEDAVHESHASSSSSYSVQTRHESARVPDLDPSKFFRGTWGGGGGNLWSR
jgi:hypothetical protein